MSFSYQKFLKQLEKYLPAVSIGAFILGIVLASWWDFFACAVDYLMSFFIDAYIYIAPIVIYVILASSLAKILTSSADGRKFTRYVIFWFAKLRFLACLLGVVFTGLVFGLPLWSNSSLGLGGSVLKTLNSLGWMLVHSWYFYALYAAIITVMVSPKIPKVQKVLERCSDLIEEGGKYLVPLVPLFMLAVGSYLYRLPVSLGEQIDSRVLSHLARVEIFGLGIETNTAGGIIMIYLAGGILTGLACMLWHFGLLLVTKYKIRDFSIKNYFKNYWARVYPFLWATSSEALATPLNLHLIKRHYPQIRKSIRRFVVGAGSFLNINGTMICVFVLAGLVASILGVEISIIQLLLTIPLVFLLGYGVPGIPGELLIFAGPMVVLLGIPESIVPVFLVLYLGLQIGLPDSFRTGANSTDNCVAGILMDKVYKEKFTSSQKSIRLGVD